VGLQGVLVAPWWGACRPLVGLQHCVMGACRPLVGYPTLFLPLVVPRYPTHFPLHRRGDVCPPSDTLCAVDALWGCRGCLSPPGSTVKKIEMISREQYGMVVIQ
jgi:hypothetical protein